VCSSDLLIEISTAIMFGKKLRDIGILELPPTPYVSVKVPQFSFMRLSGADPVLGVEMLSTGEVACIGENFADALLKALQSAEFTIPNDDGAVLITVGGEEMKRKIIPLAKSLSDLGFKIYATEHTADALYQAGLRNVTVLYKVSEPTRKPNIVEYIVQRKIDLVINIPAANPNGDGVDVLRDEYIIRRLAVEYNIPIVTTFELASAIVKVLKYRRKNEIIVRSLNEYMDSLPLKYW
jgi:carbamoyl-phosphate synthase large subunit